MADIPKIRFKGFTEPWEQRKLGELVEFYNGDRSSRYPNDSDMVSEGVPFINAGDLVSGRVKLDTANKITEEKFNELSGAKIQRGDIIYCLRGTLGKNAFVDNFDVGTVASSLVDIRPKKVVGKYLYQVLNSDIEYTQRIVNDEGAAQPNLSAKNLSLFNIPMPDEVEQEKIAAYFDDFDNLITLHQRKCDDTKELKKYMLQKMFPKNGEKFPEIRFKGFTEAWEQRKVSELCSISTGKSNTQDKVEDGMYPFYVRSPIVERSTKYLYDEEAVITVGDGVGTGKVFHYVNGKYDLHQRCYRMYDFTNELNAHYFYHTFSKLFYKRVMAMTAKTSVDSVRLEMISDMKIPCPNIKEQEKIGAYFNNLDNLITLHQRKCDTLKELKKYMLQNMFPKKG